MSEKTQRRRVVEELRPLDAVSVENPAHPGTPDVNFIEGWIELKHVYEWPKGEGVPLRLEHFTKQQRVWLTRRQRKGGLVVLILQVKQEWFILDACWSARLLGDATRAEIVANALVHWPKGPKRGELLQWFRQRLKSSGSSVAARA